MADNTNEFSIMKAGIGTWWEKSYEALKCQLKAYEHIDKLNLDDISRQEFERIDWLYNNLNHEEDDEFSLSSNITIEKSKLTEIINKKYPTLKGYYNDIRAKNSEIPYIKECLVDSGKWYQQLEIPMISGYAFLPDNVKNSIKDKVFFDFGACYGHESLMFSELSKEVYTFEPMGHFSTVVEKVKKFNKTNINCVNKGVGKVEDKLTFFTPNGIASRSRPATKEEIKLGEHISQVEIVTIDNFVSQNKIENVGLMKFDIEGMERPALESGLETIRKNKPVLLISVYHNYSDFYSTAEFIDKLNLGYKFMYRHVLHDDNNHWTLLVPHELMLICYV